MYMRASGASELRKFCNFAILKLLFLSIFCWYIRYFVGTNDMFVGSHVYTNNTPKRHYWGGGGAIAPLPPPPLATLMLFNIMEADVKLCSDEKLCSHGSTNSQKYNSFYL